MVSIGTVIGIGAAAAAGLGLYAVYQNRSRIGAALARGTEVNITNPLGSWLDSLFNNNENNGENQQNNPPVADPNPNPDNDFIPCSNNPADYRTWCNGYVPPPDQDFLPPAPPAPPAPEVPPEENEDRGSRPRPNPPAPEVPESAAIRLSNVNQNSRQQLLDRAEEISEDSGVDLGTSVNEAILEVSSPGSRFYDIYLNGELRFNEYPLTAEARQYFLNEGFSVRTADGV